MSRKRFFALVIAFSLLLPTVLWSADLAELVELDGVGQLKAAFNADVGSPRLVLLLSPT